MTADKGWYDGIGFTINAKSRTDYIELLKSCWWVNVNLKQAKERCNVFAGMVYCCPEWQKGLVCGDDTEQWKLFADIEQMVVYQTEQLSQEIETIRNWYASGYEGYHTYKMLYASKYALSNLVCRN